jgi:hypothetical protein
MLVSAYTILVNANGEGGIYSLGAYDTKAKTLAGPVSPVSLAGDVSSKTTGKKNHKRERIWL